MALALHRTASRYKVPNPVTQVELVPKPDANGSDLAEARDAVRLVPIFKDVLDEQQLDTLVAACSVRILPRDTVFIHQAEAGTSMFVILEGAARVSIVAPNGESRDVAVLSGGDIVGEMSLMTGVPRTATVTSMTELRVLEVTKESIESLLAETPGLMERFGRVLAARQMALNTLANTPQQAQSTELDILARMRVFFARAFR